MLANIKFPVDNNVLVGVDTWDDAGVYRVSDDNALVFTTDFFPPAVQDPVDNGRIVAANCVSDIYAMGAKPMLALSLLAFPEAKIPVSVAGEIVRGGAEKLAEAGVILLGGHTQSDVNISFGFAILGNVHPDRIVTNSRAKPGDKIILTKPLGSGVITTAMRAPGFVSREMTDKITAIMIELNKLPAELMLEHGVHAATDVTGYGFMGHLSEILDASNVSCRLSAGSIPYLPEAVDFVKDGWLPPGSKKNREYMEGKVEIDSSIPEEVCGLFFDAQTSGGLIVVLPPERSQAYLDALDARGKTDAAVVGEVVEKSEKNVYLRN